MQKLKLHIFILFSIVIICSQQINAQGTSPVGVNFVLVNFNQPPTFLTVNKAPLKYNKDFALSLQIDDGNISLFSIGYPFFEGLDGNPGLFYTDGCGNSHSFKMSSALYVFNSNGINGPDIHTGNWPEQLTWEQLDTIYSHNWGILNHGVNGNNSSDPSFMNYSIRRNRSYIRRKMYNLTDGGVLTNVVVNPGGNSNYTIPAFNNGNISALYTNTISPIGNNGGDVNNDTVDWTQPHRLNRKVADATDVISLVNGLASSSVGGANYWCPIFTHSLSSDYTSFVSDFNTIANTYGSNGLDNILMATVEEIQDYLIVRDATTLNYNLAGTTLLITYSGEVPDNLLYYSSSIVINSDAAISSITVDGATDYTYTGIGQTDALINLNWDGYYVIPPGELADSMVTIAVGTQHQYDCWVAMDYVITMTNGPHKDSLRQVLCAIPNVTYDAGFCDCSISLPQTEITIPSDSCIMLNGAPGNYTHEWLIGDSLVDTTQNYYACPADTTLYTHIATNTFGCPAQDSILVNIDFLSFDLGPDTTICLGECVTITGPDAMAIYNWFVADTLYSLEQSITPCPLDTTQYTLWVEDFLGATAEDSITINVLAIPIVNLQPSDTTICDGDCILLSGPAGNYTYGWWVKDVLINTTQNYNACPEDTTQYNLIVTATNGCSGEDSIMINVDSLYFDLGPDKAICLGDTDTLSGPNDMITYNWIVADTTYDTLQTIYPSPIDTTQFILQVVDSIGCTAEDTIIINVLPIPILNLPPDTTIRFGECIELSGPDSMEVYNWIVADTIFDSVQTINPCPLDTTLYTLIVTDSLGCSAEDSIMINIKFLSFSLGADTSICEGSSINLSGPPDMQMYKWYENTLLIDTINQTITRYPTEMTQYKLWVMDTLGGTAEDSIVISVRPSPTVSFGEDSLYVCNGDDILISVIGSPEINSYWWTYDGELIWTGDNNVLDLINPDTSDYVYVEGTRPNGCRAYDTTFLTVLQYPEILISNDTTICSGQPVTLTVSGGSIFRWIAGSDTISTNPTIIVNPEITTNYIAQTAFSDSMCFREDTVTVTVHNSAATKILYDTNVVCTYQLVTLTGSGADHYLWTPSGDTNQVYTFQIFDTTTIWLTGTTFDGCQLTDSATFYTKPSPEVNFTGLLPVYCENDTWSLLTGTPINGIFFGPGIVGSKFFPESAGPGTHDIVYSYVNLENCVGYDTNTTIVYSNDGLIDLGPNFTILPQDSTILDAGAGFDNYYWNTGAITQSIMVFGDDKSPGTYEYAVIGVISGCSTRGNVFITFEKPDGYNEQHINDLKIYPNPSKGSFTIEFSSVEKNIQLRVTNMQGILLYENDNVSCNKECKIDVQLKDTKPGIYILQITTPKGVSTGKIILK